MEEIMLRLGHDLPFNNISKLFPEATIYRWCNSKVDYLEIQLGEHQEVETVRQSVEAFAEHIRSEVLFLSSEGNLLTAMVACRCSNVNSTVRMAESADCLWKAPVTYSGGEETLTLISPENQSFRRLFSSLQAIGSVSIVRKTTLLPSALRDSYTLSLSDLFGSLTEKQVHHLASAASSGYFSIPKKTSIGNLAAHEKLSESTLQEHLSKAESKLMEALIPYVRLYMSSSLKGEEEKPQ